MRQPSFLFLNLVLLFLVAAGGAFWWEDEKKEGVFEVVFLDVGQGDAILLQEGSWQVLIDGGRSGQELLSRLGRYLPFWDRRLDVVVATHPDSDHIGGLPSVIRQYRPSAVLSNGDTSDTDVSRLFEERAKEFARAKETVGYGTEIEFPSGAKLTVLYPARPLGEHSTLESNEGSIVARLSYGETDFLLTGDLPTEERYLRESGEVEILKVAHHGSRSSTSDAFLDGVRPREAIISVGKENTYGHPAGEVLENLRERNIVVYRTDEQGDIRYRCLPSEKICRRTY